jgi:hypothetical protein
MHHLAGGMNPGVGASCRHGMHRAMGVEDPNRFLKSLLHTAKPTLALPAMES